MFILVVRLCESIQKHPSALLASTINTNKAGFFEGSFFVVESIDPLFIFQEELI